MKQRENLGSRILTGGAALFTAQAVTMVIYFLAQRIILSTLTKEANGVLFAERRFVDLFVILLVDFGMNIVAMRRMVQQPERAANILSSTVAFRVVVWLPISLFCLLYAQITSFSILDVGLWCIYVFISARTGLLRYSYEMPYRAKMKFFVPALYSVMDAVLFLALIWWWRNELDPSRVIIAFTLTAIPGFLLMFLSDRGRMIRLRFMEVAEIRTLLREALPVIVAFVFLGLHDKADALLMDWLSTDKELGIYGAAFTSLAPFIGTIPFTLAMTMVPAISHLAKEDPVRSHRYSMTALRIMIVGAVILCAVASPLAPFFIDVVSKGRYANNVIHFFLFLWMPLPIFILAFTQDLMNAYSKQRDYVYVAVTLATLTVAAGLLLIPWLHALGATIAKLISVATGAAVALWLFRRILREGITLTFVTSVVVLTIVGVTASVFLPTVMSMWAAAALCGGITLATSFGLGLLRWKDLTLIRTMLGSTRRAHHS